MVDNAHILLEELALGLSADARVLLVEPSFELLSRVAMTNVKELVVINADADPDAPATTTPTGAPLRMRPDWKERPRSKDLIVDAAGDAPKLEIERILKKAGAYLSLKENPVSRSLPISQSVRSKLTGLMILGTPQIDSIDPSSAPMSDGDAVQLSSRIPVDVPSVFALARAGQPAEVDTLRASLAAAQATSTKQAHGMAELKEKHAALKAEKEQLRRTIQNLTGERDSAVEKEREARQSLEGAQASLAELEDEYEGVRTELAEARVSIKRTQRLDERLEVTRSELNREIENLQERLRLVDARSDDVETVVQERRMLLQKFGESIQRVGDILNRALPGRNLPAPPIPGVTQAQDELLNGWLALALERATVAQGRDAERTQEIRSLRGRLNRALSRLEGTEALLAAEAASTTNQASVPRVAKGTKEKRLQRENSALKQALKAEKALRKVAEDTVEDMETMTAYAIEQKNSSLEAVVRLTAALRDARLSEITAEEEVIRSTSELDERAVRIEELEGILTTHHQLQQLMSDAVKEAQEAREDADYARRLADENLRIMQTEMERLQESR